MSSTRSCWASTTRPAPASRSATTSLVRAEAYDVSHFPELKDQYGAMSVPCIVINRGAVAGAEGEGGEAEQKVEFGKKSIPQMLELVGA